MPRKLRNILGFSMLSIFILLVLSLSVAFATGIQFAVPLGGPPDVLEAERDKYRQEQHQLLEGLARTEPDKQVRALVVMRDYYPPQQMADIMDLARFRTTQIWSGLPPALVAGIPEFEHYTFILGHTTNPEPVRVEDFLEIFLKQHDENLSRHMGRYSECRAQYEQMRDEWSPEEKEGWETYIKSIRSVIELYSQFLPHELGIYAVAVEGTAEDLNTLAQRPEVDLVDPALRSRLSVTGWRGTVTGFEFVPPQPGKL